MTEDERQATIDSEHLRILSMCYYLYAGINAFFSLFGLFYAFMGLALSATVSRASSHPGQDAPPEFVGLLLAVIGLGLFAILLSLSVLKFLAATRLRKRRGRVFCIVVAAFTCLGIPFGTALGVFTFLVLSRRSVASMFDSASSSAPGVVVGEGGA